METVQSVVEQNGFVAIHEQNLKVEEDGEGWETVCYSKKNRTPEKCSSECSSESRDISHDYGGEPRVKGLVTASGDLQPILKRVIPAEKDRSSVNEDNGSAADNGPAIVDSKPVTSGDDTLGNGVEALAGNVTCDADESVSPIILQESIEDKELSELNENRYVYFKVGLPHTGVTPILRSGTSLFHSKNTLVKIVLVIT